MFVPWDEQILPIERIKPSSAHELLHGCRMKAVLSKYPNSEVCNEGIPVHPNSSIGTIYHRLLEAARRNNPSNGTENWDADFTFSVLTQLTEQENQSLLQNPLNAHLAPLNDNSMMVWVNEVNFIDLYNWMILMGEQGGEIEKMNVRKSKKDKVNAQISVLLKTN